MGITLLGPAAQDFPKKAAPVYVEVRWPLGGWGDGWQIDVGLEMVAASRVAGGHDMSRAEFRHRYAGSLMQPWRGVFENWPAWPRMYGTWVRVRIVDDQGLQTVFVGRISDEARDVHGSTADAPSGNQFFVAYGPEDILRKIFISESYWNEGGLVKQLGWVPPMNRRDEHNTLVGNRTAAKVDGTHLYDDSDTWSHLDYVEYILARFVDESDAGGPAWTVGGMADALAEMKEAIDFGTTATVAQILAKLIDPQRGVDYMITPTDDGFEVTIFTLLSKAWAGLGGGRVPPNPFMVHVAPSETIDVQPVDAVLSGQDRYGKIRVLGERIVVCGSLCTQYAASAFDVSGIQWGEEVPVCTLEPHWSANPLQWFYDAGTAELGDSAEDHDKARRNERYRPVYQLFAAPDGYTWPAPGLDKRGVVIPFIDQDAQSIVRQTLPWLPLREGVDYSDDPVTDEHPAWHEPDLLPPMVWIRREKEITADEESQGAEWFPERSWFPAESVGIGISILQHEWGVWLSSQPNHLVAANHFDPDGVFPSEIVPLYDYDYMVATIAVRTDQRLHVEASVLGASASDGVLEIEIPGAELWYLRPGTVVGQYLPTGELAVSNRGGVIRNDREKLLTVLAGAQVRHMWDRARARITIAGLVPWQNLLGCIMVVKDNPDKHLDLEAPITAVEWIAPSDQDQEGADPGSTIIRTGYAT